MKKICFGSFIVILFILITPDTAMTVDRNKYYYIKSVLSDDRDKGYWDLSGFGKSYKNGDNLHLWAFDKGNDRKYMITPAGNGWDYISPANSAFGGIFRGTVDVSGEPVKNGSKLYILDMKLTDNSSQQFKIKDIGDGKAKIYANKGNGKKIVCADGDTDRNGTAVIVLDDNENPACQWRFIEAGRT